MNKLEIIKEINTLKRNKYKCQNIEQYSYKLNSLYKKLSDANGKTISQPIKEGQPVKIIYKDELNLSDDEKIDKVIDDIMNFATHSYLLEKLNVKLLSKKYPLFDLFLIENNLIEKNDNIRYEIQIKPKVENDVDNAKFIEESKFLLKLCEIVIGKNNKVLIVLIMYDYIFKNFSFCLKYKKYGITIKNKTIELKLDADIFNDMENKYNLEPDIITKWCDEIDKLIVDE